MVDTLFNGTLVTHKKESIALYILLLKDVENILQSLKKGGGVTAEEYDSHFY